MYYLITTPVYTVSKVVPCATWSLVTTPVYTICKVVSLYYLITTPVYTICKVVSLYYLITTPVYTVGKVVSLYYLITTPVYTVGIVVSLYYLITNYLNDDPSAADDPISHICTDALLCILFRFGPNKEHTGRKLSIFLNVYLIFLFQFFLMFI